MFCRSVLILGGWLFAGAAGLLAQDLNPTITVNPVQPSIGEPVSIRVSFTIAQSCYFLDDVTPVLSGTTITLRVGDCPIGTPPPTPPTRYTNTWELGPLPAGIYTVRFLFDSTLQAKTSFQVLSQEDHGFTMAVGPPQPRVGQPVRVDVTFHDFGCYFKGGAVITGTTIDLHVTDCLIATPPRTFPGTVESWELGELPAGTYTVRFLYNDFFLDQFTFRVLACAPGTLCLQDDRFEVKAEWASDISSFGTATPVQLTPDTGYFWFFQPENVELLVKVLDGCALNGHFWVFAAGLTDVETRIRVTDTLLGTTQTYNNPRGTPFAPVQRTSAFGCD